VVVGRADGKIDCFDGRGNQRWSVQSPADAWGSVVEPRSGAIEVLQCGDITGDGRCEIIAGRANWFAYCYDKEG